MHREPRSLVPQLMWTGAIVLWFQSVGFAQTGHDCNQCIPVAEGSLTGMTGDNPAALDDSSCATSDIVSEWYCFTPTCSGKAFARTCGPANDFNTTLSVFTACDLLTELACNDDLCGTGAQVMWPVVAGTTYYVRVSGASGATGTYELDLACATGNLAFFLGETGFENAAAQAGLEPIDPRGIEDFEEAVLPAPPNNTAIMDDPLDAATNNGVFAPGDIAAGLTFQSNLNPPAMPAPRGIAGLAVLGPGFMGAVNVGVVANFPQDSFDTIFSLAAPQGPVKGAGLDLLCETNDGVATLRVFDTENIFLGLIILPVDISGRFVGVIVLPPPPSASAYGETDVGIGRANERCNNAITAFGGLPAREGLYELTAYASTCGNGVVDVGEDCTTCPDDVTCAPPTFCSAGACVECVTDVDCGDSNPCNGEEICSENLCQPGVDLNCDDDNTCTDDSCVPLPMMGCQHVNNSEPCDDGDACTAGDTCTDGSCVGSAKVCDDAVACTVDDCDSNTGCFFTPDDMLCDNGLFCDGVETCDAMSGCVGGSSPCAEGCDEDGDRCFKICDGDLNRDGTVDSSDLALLLGDWGSYAPCPPYAAADLDQDCDVDSSDLAVLLGNWGTCL